MNEEIFDLDHISKTYFTLAIPVVLGMVVTLVYNLADTYFIGATGNTNLVAGVSLCSPIFTTLMAFGNIYGQGGSSLISRFLGQNNQEKVHHISSFCFYVAIFTGLIISILMLLFKSPLLTLFGASSDTITYASEYYTVLAIGAPFTVLSFIHSNLLRCEGYAKESMIGSMTGTILNIILDPILITNCNMGAKGAAIATVLGYTLTDIFFIFIVLKKSRCLSLKLKEITIQLNDCSQIFGIGISAAITNIMQSMCVIIMNQFLLAYGAEKIAAMGIVLKVNMITQLILTGFAFGGVPLFGYLYGAKKTDKLKELITFCIKLLSSLSLGLTLVVFVFAKQLMAFMMDNSNVIATGTVMLRWQVISTVFVGVVLLMTCLFQASGKVIPAFIMSISRQGVIFALALVILVNLFNYQGLIMAQCAADIVSAAIGLGLYIKVMK